MFRSSLATNDVQASTRTSKSKNSWTIELCLSIQVCKRREIHAVRAKNADCTCTHSTWLILLFEFWFPFFLFCFDFLHHCHCKTTPLLTSGVTSRYILLHPVSGRTSLASGLSIQFIQHSSPIDYPNI